MMDLFMFTAARVIEASNVRIEGHEEWRRLLARRPDSGMACVLRSYAYGPALEATGPVTGDEAVSIRVIERLKSLAASSYGNCTACSMGKIHAVLLRDLALEYNSVLLACDYCPWRGPISFIAGHIIEEWVAGQKGAVAPTDQSDQKEIAS